MSGSGRGCGSHSGLDNVQWVPGGDRLGQRCRGGMRGAGANSHHQNLHTAHCQRVGQAHWEWPSTSETPAMAPGGKTSTVSVRAGQLRCFVQPRTGETHRPQRCSQRAGHGGPFLPTFWRCDVRRSTARAGEVLLDGDSGQAELATGGKIFGVSCSAHCPTADAARAGARKSGLGVQAGTWIDAHAPPHPTFSHTFTRRGTPPQRHRSVHLAPI